MATITPAGRKLKRFIEDRDLTVNGFADYLGCTRITLYNIMHGKVRPNEKIAAKLRDLCGIESDYLPEKDPGSPAVDNTVPTV